MIGYGLWQQLFGGDPKVLGATIRIDGNPLTVVGDPRRPVSIFRAGQFSGSRLHSVLATMAGGTVARLKPGISWPQARAALAVEVERLSSKAGRDHDSRLHPSMASLRNDTCRPPKNASLIFMGAVLLVPADCVHECRQSPDSPNHRTRRSELSIRTALGASRARLARQSYRMPIPLIRCHSRRICDRILDNLALSKD